MSAESRRHRSGKNPRREVVGVSFGRPECIKSTHRKDKAENCDEVCRASYEHCAVPGCPAPAPARVERETATVLSGATASRAALQKALTESENALRNLRHLRVRDQINDEEFASDRQALETERLRLTEQLAQADPAEAFEPARLFVSFSNRALKWFREGDDEVRRLILEITGSNPLLKDRELKIDARFPFRKWSRKRPFSQLCTVVNDIRTRSREPEIVKLASQIQRVLRLLRVTDKSSVA